MPGGTLGKEPGPGRGLVPDPEPPGRGGVCPEEPGHRALEATEHTVLIFWRHSCQNVPNLIIS